MRRYEVYALREDDLEELSVEIGKELNVDFQKRHSSYLGPYLQHRSTHYEKIQIRVNHVQEDEEDSWVEEDFKEYPTLIFVTISDELRSLKDLLASRYPESQIVRISISEDNGSLVRFTYKENEQIERQILRPADSS